MGRRELSSEGGIVDVHALPQEPPMSSHSSHTLHDLGREAEGRPGSPSSLPAREALQLALSVPGSALLLSIVTPRPGASPTGRS